MIKINDPNLELLGKKLRERMNEISDHVAAEGKCADFPEYKYMTGTINGLAEAERFLLDIDDMLHRNDDGADDNDD